MTFHRVAALERQGTVLLVSLGEARGGKVRVLTEDGRDFDYPAERLLWTARRLRVEGETKRETAAALKVLRAGAAPPPDWKALHGRVEAGIPLDLGEVAGGGEDAAADGRALAVAIRAHESGPHFRLDHGRLVAATPEEIRAEAERAEAERRAKDAEAALEAALRAGSAAAAPLPEAARPALEALLAWALGPEDGKPPRPAGALGLRDVYEALERLDAAGLLPADALPPLSRRGIPQAFPRKARDGAAAAAQAPDPAASREDLRALPAFAVDDPGTFEVDDALSMARGPGGEPHFLVHISDAAAAIPADGPVDAEARRRAVTVYLPETKVPMIPPDLIAARLSLEEGRDREAVTVEFRVGADGAPEPVRAFRSLVRVARGLDYEGTAEEAGLPQEIRPLLEAARELRRRRIEGGARVLETPAAHLRVKDGAPILERRGIGGAGDVLVGEAAVAYNRVVAERLRAAGAAALWRLQDAPKGDLPPTDDPLFSLKARRLFAPVRYALAPGRHSGVGADAYLQATSPIRRYADLVHQRQFVALLEGTSPPHAAAGMKELAPALYAQERLVRAAEGEREDFWMAVLLEGRRREVFDAFVSRAPQRGRGFAWIPEFLAEFPFRWPLDRKGAPADGAPIRVRVGRLARHRGRVEFEVA